MDDLIEKLELINTCENKVKFIIKRSIGIDVADEETLMEAPQFIKRFKTTDTDRFEIIKSTNLLEILLPVPKNVYMLLVNCKDLIIDRYSSKGYKWIINSTENIERFYECCKINNLNFNQVELKNETIEYEA